MYVLDGQASRLVAFAADGGILWSAGRAGDGPGELSNSIGNAGDLALTGSGSIAVTNHQSTRLDLWSTSGEYIDKLGATLVAQTVCELLWGRPLRSVRDRQHNQQSFGELFLRCRRNREIDPTIWIRNQ